MGDHVQKVAHAVGQGDDAIALMMVGLAMLTVYCAFLAIKGLIEDDSKKAAVVKTAEQIAEELE